MNNDEVTVLIKWLKDVVVTQNEAMQIVALWLQCPIAKQFEHEKGTHNK